jgi:hypothetical protein
MRENLRLVDIGREKNDEFSGMQGDIVDLIRGDRIKSDIRLRSVWRRRLLVG